MARPDARLLRLDRRVRLQLVLLAGSWLVVGLLVVLQARVLAGTLARTIGAGVRPTALAQPVTALLLIVAARAVLAWIVTTTSGSTARRAKSTLRAAIATRVLHEDPGSGPADAPELTVLLARGLDGLDGYFTRYLPQLVAAVVVPLVVGLAILGADVTSAIVIGITLPLIPLFMVLIGMATRERERRSWRSLARLAHHYTDLLAGLPTLKVFGRARAQVEGLRRTNDAYRTETVSTLRLAFCSALVLELGSTLAVALVAVGIGLRLLDGGLSLETAFFVLLLAPEVFLPVRAVGIHYHESAAGIAVAERSFEILDAAPVSHRPAGRRAGGTTPDGDDVPRPGPEPVAPVTFDHVCFTYPERSVRAVDDLTFTLEPGEIVALTGASGSGKSTAVAILLGLIDPDLGSVRVGGRDVRRTRARRLAPEHRVARATPDAARGNGGRQRPVGGTGGLGRRRAHRTGAGRCGRAGAGASSGRARRGVVRGRAAADRARACIGSTRGRWSVVARRRRTDRRSRPGDGGARRPPRDHRHDGCWDQAPERPDGDASREHGVLRRSRGPAARAGGAAGRGRGDGARQHRRGGIGDVTVMLG